jgi:hypothetical protein
MSILPTMRTRSNISVLRRQPCTHDKPVVISNTIASDDDETPITRKPIAHSRAVIAIASDDEMVAASPVKARAKPTQRIALRECVDDEAGESVC